MGISSQYTSFIDSAKKRLFFRQIKVLHYMPGRIRLYSQYLRDNPEIVRQVNQHLQTMPEITQFSMNSVTGSLLICYCPADVLRNPFLRELEQLVIQQYRG